MEKDRQHTDEHEKKVGELIEKLTKGNHRNNAIVFREAASQIKKSANPEAQEIHDFMLGMSKQQEAKAERDPHHAIRLFDESIKYLRKCNWEDKISDEYSETKILKLMKDLEINSKNPARLTDLFFEIATEEKKRGNEKDYNVNMEEAIKRLSTIIEGSFQNLSAEDNKLYITEQRHKSGVSIRLYHAFFHLPNEN